LGEVWRPPVADQSSIRRGKPDGGFSALTRQRIQSTCLVLDAESGETLAMVADNHTVESPPHGQPAGDPGDAPWASGRIDRLVTGELDDAERLELLAWLDAEPTRWRRCGLAFLEAQALRESLTAIAEGGVALGAIPAASRPVGPRPACLPPCRAMLAAAAAVMLAFMLGWALGHRPPTLGEDSGMAATGGSSEESAAAAPRTATLAGNQPGGPTPFPTRGSRVALARVRVGEGPHAREVILPVLAGTPGDTSWERAPGPIPDYVRQQWERQGYRVTERRQTVPFKLADGRQVDVPVEEVMLTFVGQPLL
jgi:hypothetical protein